MSPTAEVEVRRNRHGSVLAYADRDRAARLLADHRSVLQSLYALVDRRHGADGETVARLAVREDSRVVDELDLRDRFRRDLDADRAISLVEDLRYHAGEREVVTDGGREVHADEGDGGDDLARVADALELQNALLLRLVQDQRRDAARNDPNPDREAPSDRATATDVVDAYGDLYGGSVDGWVFDPVSEQTDDMGDSQ